MTFREVSTIAGTSEQVDGASLALSNEASSLLLAQARDKTTPKPATDAATPAQAGASATKNDGPLAALLDPTGNKSPSRLFPDILKADEKWQKPYSELTKIDGHALLERHDGAMNRAGGVLYEMPKDKADEMRRLANDYLAGKSTPDAEKTLATSPDLMDSLKTLRETFGDPNLPKAQQWSNSVRTNLDESIKLRTEKAEYLSGLRNQYMRVDGTAAVGNALGLILETKQLERYKRGS